MRNFYTFLLSGLFLCLLGNLSAQDDLTIGLTDADGAVGETICVDLVGDNFVNLTGMQFSIEFDTAFLEFVSAMGNIAGTNVGMSYRSNFPTIIRVNYAPFSTQGFTSTGPFVIGQICFLVKQDGPNMVTIEDAPSPLEFILSENGTQTVLGPDDVIINNATINGGSPAATCTDGIRNGSETGIDCGGPDCPACPPTCTDGVQNGSETGVDCGGPDCPACPSCTDGIRNGRETGVDCGGPDCAACPATCSDGIQNGSETGVDCGGPDCAACPATCSDGIQNGDETGVDCGGSCADCGGGDTCGAGSDRLNICLGEACDIAVGAQACVPITATNFNSVVGFEIDVVYPGANLDFTSFTPAPRFGDQITFTERSDGMVRILMFDQSNIGVTLNDGDAIGTICFTAETTSRTTLSLERLNFGTRNGPILGVIGNAGAVNGCGGNPATCTDGMRNGNETGVDCGGPDCAPCATCSDGVQNGNETGVDCGGPDCMPCNTGGGNDTCGEGSDRLNICVADVCDVTAGAQFCMDITVSNYTNINGFDFELRYPAGNLDYSSFSSTTPFASSVQASGNTDGVVKFVFFVAADVAFSLDDNAVLGTVCFTNETTGATTITPADLSFSSLSGSVLGVIGNPGVVNGSGCSDQPTCNDGIQNGTETGVDCGGTCVPCQTTCGEATTDVEVCVGSVCGDAGAEVCVPVMVGNFTDLVGLQFFLEWDAANLDFTRFTANPALVSGSQIAAPRMNGVPVDGVVRALWNDPSLAGVDLSPTDVAFEVCFTVENAVPTPITFQDPARQLRAFLVGNTGVPIQGSPGAVNQNCGDVTPTCSDGIQNGDETGVDCGGSCAPCNGGGGGNDTCAEGSDRLNLCVADACGVAVGAQFCVDLTVSNYTDVVGFDFEVNYPAANLDFESFTSTVPFANAIQTNGATDGQVKFIFFIAADMSFDLADNAVLGELCFTNQSAAESTITPERLSFGSSTGSIVGPIGNGGTVNAPGCGTAGPSCTDGIRNGDETGVDCGGSCAPCPGNEITIRAGSGTAQIGQQVCVDVTVEDFVNIDQVAFTLNFNASVLTLASVTANSALVGFGADDFNTNTAGRIGVNYDPATAQTLADGEPLFTVCFNVAAGDEVPLTISNTAATSANGTTLTVNRVNGTINAGGVVDYTNFTLVVGNATGAVGTEVCVDVTVFNLENLAALQFAIGYDQEKLQFTSATSTGALQGLQAANPFPGTIRTFWFDQAIMPNSVPDGNSIITLCFNVLQACDAPLPFLETRDFRTTATDPNNMAVTPIDRVAGSINAGEPCGGPGTPDNLVLQVGSADGTVGTEVCVDVSTTNFTSLTELGFSLTYDAAKVTFSRATNFGLNSVTAANVTSTPAGSLGFDWNAPTSTGQTLASGASLLSLCFTVNQVSITPINFANTPVAITARNASNQNVGVVPSGGSINPNAPVIDGLTFQIGSASASVGEEICLPVIGFEVIDLVSFQYTINFDPTKLEYLGTGTEFALNGFSSGLVQNIQPGVITVAWADPFADPNTVPDGTAIYSLCFRVLSTDMTLVTFGGSPTAIEFELVNGITDADLINGQVNGTAAPVIVDATLGRPSCFGDADGSIALTVSGSGNLAYQWSPNVSTSNSASGLRAGGYSVTVTNTTTGQSDSEQFTLTDGSLFTLEVASVSGVGCFGDADGQITLAPVNAEGSLLYDWSGNLPDRGPQQRNLDGGSYSVTVTDGNGCRRVQNNIMVGEPTQELRIIGAPVNIGASGRGGVTIEIVGGRSPYRYSWSGPNNYSSTEEDINDVTNPGTYCLTVTDNNGCTDEQCFAVIGALAVSFDVDRGCAGENNGAIGLSVSGATGGYTYRWTGPNGFMANTKDITELAPGDYTVVVTSGSETRTLTIEVESAVPINLSNVVVGSATTGNNGSITLTPSGGNSPYTYRWDDGVTTQNRTGLSSGQYCVTVTDNSGCTEDACFTVNAMSASIVSIASTPASCNDGADGTVTLVLRNGTAPFRVQLTPGGVDQTSDDETIVLTGVAAATYTVLITDAQGNNLDTTITVSAPDAITVTARSTSDTEDLNCSGSVMLDINGGTAPYGVSWSNGASGMTISQLCAGDYAATVTDGNGCVFVVGPQTVGRIDTELNEATSVACADGTEGAILVTVTGGVEPYTFAWRRAGSQEVISTNEDLLASDVSGGVTAGDYVLLITDATGASLQKNYTIDISAGFSVDIATPTPFNGFSVSCPGATDGRIEIDISGQGSFMYEFVLNGAMVGVDSVLENAAAGVYTVTVIDDGNCTITREVTLTEPPALDLSATVQRVSCSGVSDGSLVLTPSGGVPNYTINWSTGETTARINGLSAGDYTATVTDANGCTLAETFTVTAPEDLAFTFDATDATDGCNGSIRIIPLGGSGNYRYSWPELPNQGNDPFAEGLCPGDYIVEVTDDNNCQTVTMNATVLDRRFPCLNAREVISPNGDGLNEKFTIFCSDGDEAINNNLQVFNRWGQRVYFVKDYDCSDDTRGTTCFEGLTNGGEILPDGAYYYIFEFTNLQGEAMQQRGSLSIVRD